MLRRQCTTGDVTPINSKLFEQDGFYEVFAEDLKRAKRQVIIESPFITSKRVHMLLPLFKQLIHRKVQVVINTKPLEEQSTSRQNEVGKAIKLLDAIGVLILITSGHHRKLAIIDQQILWEGSLNILSQNESCEVMRRIYSEQVANQMLAFLHLDKFLD